MAQTHTQEIHLRDIPTTRVTLYPSQALIDRQLDNLELRPGANEVVVYGLTPSTDEHSIKVEGTGSAAVTDMTVDLVTNKESFEDFFPDTSEPDYSDDESESDDDEDDGEVKALRKQVEQVDEKEKLLPIQREAIRKRLNYLADYFKYAGKGDTLPDPERLARALATYEEDYIAKSHELSLKEDESTKLQEERGKLETKISKLTRAKRIAAAKAKAEKSKTKEKQSRDKVNKARELAKEREEHAKYWPLKVYKVTISLDVSVDTPGSSRRNSIDSVSLAKESQDGEARPFSLRLSYLTTCVAWSPRYDIELSTSGGKTGKIGYRAEFHNHTSETWSDAKILLSTTQASFGGIGETVPFMHPWKIGLAKSGSSSLQSYQETVKPRPTQAKAAEWSRAGLFGANVYAPPHLGDYRRAAAHKPIVMPPPPAAAPAPMAAATMRSHAHYAQVAPGATAAFGGAPAMAKRARAGPSQEVAQDFFADDMTLAEAAPPIDYEEASWEDHGMTTIFELPGTRTLAPSSTTRRYKIASLRVPEVFLTSIAVPKLRTAAFMRARFRNPSASVTLLRGAAGITLDGTFLGTTQMPRVSPNELIELPLGVDPTIHVSYAKPAVKRSTLGFIAKEAAQLFTRSIVITNTKPQPTELLVLDQIPISEDDKLRVDVVEPEGLVQAGGAVACGKNAKDAKDRAWGKARASLKSSGEVRIEVSLAKGAAVVIGLSYETRAPPSEQVVTKG